MTPEEFAKLKPEDPKYGEAEQEMFRQQQEKHAKTTEHDAATKKLHETAPAGMFAHEYLMPEKEKKARKANVDVANRLAEEGGQQGPEPDGTS